MKEKYHTGLKTISVTALALASVLSLSTMTNKSLKVKALSESDYIDFEITGLDRTTDFISGKQWRLEFKTNISFNNTDGTVESNLRADTTNTTMKFDGVTNTILDNTGLTCGALSTTDDDFTILLAQARADYPTIYNADYPGLAKYDATDPNGYGGKQHIIEMASGTTFGKYRLINNVTITISRFNQVWLNVELADYKEVQNSDLFIDNTQVPESITPTGGWIEPKFTTDLDTNSFVYKCKYTHTLTPAEDTVRFIDLRHNDWNGLRLLFTSTGNIEYWPNGSNKNDDGRVWELNQFKKGQSYQLKIGCIDIKNTNFVWIFVNIDGVDKVSFLEEKKTNSIHPGFSSWASYTGGTFEQVDYKVTIDGVEQRVLPGAKVTKPEKSTAPDETNHYEWQWLNGETVYDFNAEVHSDLNIVSKKVDTAHTFVKGDKYVAPTWEVAGSQNYVCSECDYEKVETIPALKEDFINSEIMASLSFNYVDHLDGTYDTFTNIQLQFKDSFDYSSYEGVIEERGIIVTTELNMFKTADSYPVGAYVDSKGVKFDSETIELIKGDTNNYKVFTSNKIKDYTVGINVTADVANITLLAVSYAKTAEGYYFNIAKIYSVGDMILKYSESTETITYDDGKVVEVADLAEALFNELEG